MFIGLAQGKSQVLWFSSRRQLIQSWLYIYDSVGIDSFEITIGQNNQYNRILYWYSFFLICVVWFLVWEGLSWISGEFLVQKVLIKHFVSTHLARRVAGITNIPTHLWVFFTILSRDCVPYFTVSDRYKTQQWSLLKGNKSIMREKRGLLATQWS